MTKATVSIVVILVVHRIIQKKVAAIVGYIMDVMLVFGSNKKILILSLQKIIFFIFHLGNNDWLLSLSFR